MPGGKTKVPDINFVTFVIIFLNPNYLAIMQPTVRKMSGSKRIALVAHDNKKSELIEWAIYNKAALARHHLYGTGTTGTLLEAALGQSVTKFLSGPLGGDQQIGARIAEGKIDVLIFFWDPLQSLPHDPDVKALLRIAAVWNIPVVCNRASADFIISSPLLSDAYDRVIPKYERTSGSST